MIITKENEKTKYRKLTEHQWKQLQEKIRKYLEDYNQDKDPKDMRFFLSEIDTPEAKDLIKRIEESAILR